MVDSVSSSGSVLDRISDSRTRLADSTETFLSLLTTQLKNQDPLSPMDSSEFTQQIVQMTGVEQQLLTNDLLAALVGMSDGGLAGSVDLIGKTVTAETNLATLADGDAQWSYSLPRAAANVKLEVINSAGVTVRTETLTGQGTGDQEFTWDGKNNAGIGQADGSYYLRVTATDASSLFFSSLLGRSSASINASTTVKIGSIGSLLGVWPVALCEKHPSIVAWRDSGFSLTTNYTITLQTGPQNCGSGVGGNWGVLDFNGGA
ncbi:MAG: flagellar hook assembly protein FlgD, partial [Caulobacteraceae bacterium]|nr:flagellar hook assembly protein FlgD [Caulobacteraceae bacterium]